MTDDEPNEKTEERLEHYVGGDAGRDDRDGCRFLPGYLLVAALAIVVLALARCAGA
jgi:hypothetical protein